MANFLKSFVHFPVAIFLLMGVGFFICYGIAISYNHVVAPPLWPYVSDTGANPPESCIFTLFLTWAAFFLLLTMYSYYKFVEHHKSQSRINKAAMVVGVISSFGVTMVGAFQWDKVLVPHLIGALLAFVSAIVYSWLVVILSWRLSLAGVHARTVVYTRLVLAVVESLSLVSLIAAFAIHNYQKTSSSYLAATVSEWCLIYSAILYLFSFAYELRLVRKAHVQLEISA